VVDAVSGTKAQIRDTEDAAGLRALQKDAVRSAAASTTGWALAMRR